MAYVVGSAVIAALVVALTRVSMRLSVYGGMVLIATFSAVLVLYFAGVLTA